MLRPVPYRWCLVWLCVLFNHQNAHGQDLPLNAAHWGMEVNMASAMRVPFIGRAHVLTRSLLRVSMKEVGGEIVAHQKLCDVVVEDNMRVSETIIPRPFIEAIPQETYPIAYDKHSGVFFADLGPYVVGFDPEVSGGSIPTKKVKLGILDTDKDGKPGATVHVKIRLLGLFDLYLVQRGHQRLNGVRDEETIKGSLDILYTEQHVIGASSWLFTKDTPVEIHAEASSFLLRPIDESWDCKALAEQWVYTPDGWVDEKAKR